MLPQQHKVYLITHRRRLLATVGTNQQFPHSGFETRDDRVLTSFVTIVRLIRRCELLIDINERVLDNIWIDSVARWQARDLCNRLEFHLSILYHSFLLAVRYLVISRYTELRVGALVYFIFTFLFIAISFVRTCSQQSIFYENSKMPNLKTLKSTVYFYGRVPRVSIDGRSFASYQWKST